MARHLPQQRRSATSETTYSTARMHILEQIRINAQLSWQRYNAPRRSDYLHNTRCSTTLS